MEEKFNKLKERIQKESFGFTVKKCLDCDDKLPTGPCITECTKELDLKVIQLFQLNKEFEGCRGDTKCQNQSFEKLQEVYKQIHE